MEKYRLTRTLIPITLISFFLLEPVLFPSAPAQAQECVDMACIDVFTQNGQIIIVGKKRGQTRASSAPQRVAPTLAPRKRVVRPRVSAKPSPSLRAIRKPRAPKPAITSGLSLNDRLVKILPTANIEHQPSARAIVNVPVIYWCGLPELFTTQVMIVGEVIDVTMRPSFFWSFGDGSFLMTTKPRAAFPHQNISHTYSHSGTFVVTMVATWGGTLNHSGVARTITGTVRKVSVATISVAMAPLRISG